LALPYKASSFGTFTVRSRQKKTVKRARGGREGAGGGDKFCRAPSARPGSRADKSGREKLEEGTKFLEVAHGMVQSFQYTNQERGAGAKERKSEQKPGPQIKGRGNFAQKTSQFQSAQGKTRKGKRAEGVSSFSDVIQQKHEQRKYWEGRTKNEGSLLKSNPCQRQNYERLKRTAQKGAGEEQKKAGKRE